MEQIMQQIAQEYTHRMTADFDYAFIQALNHHGYTFESQSEIEDFIARHVERNVTIDKDLYTVKGVPFFEVKTNSKINHSFNEYGELVLTADLFRYRIIEKQ